MDIIFYHPSFDTQFWLDKLSQALPDVRVREWKPGDNEPADYALVWHPPVDMLQGRSLKAVFALGAGVDSILSQLNAHPDMLPESIPLFRLEDTGMALQMQEYAVSQVLHWFRRFDDYHAQKQQARWQELDEYQREDFTISVQACWDRRWPKAFRRGDSRCAAGAVAVNPGQALKALPAKTSWAISCKVPAS